MARFLGNRNTKEVHDTYKPNNNCQLGEIKDRVTFYPDTLEQAHREGYDNCDYCLGNSQR